MKKGKILVGALLLSILFINTPSFAQAPAWTVSKGVQKVANKKQFEDQDLMKSHIHAIVVNQSWTISKGVSSIGNEGAVVKGNITSAGTPVWANGKGIHQVKRKIQVTEDVSPFEHGEEITRKGK